MKPYQTTYNTLKNKFKRVDAYLKNPLTLGATRRCKTFSTARETLKEGGVSSALAVAKKLPQAAGAHCVPTTKR
jgi:hypothetical protein